MPKQSPQGTGIFLMSTIHFNHAIEIHENVRQQEIVEREDLQEAIQGAKKEVNELLEQGTDVSYDDVQDVLLGWGLEMDYFEEMIGV